jgi:excinuclease UvrABC nuclease subunit
MRDYEALNYRLGVDPHNSQTWKRFAAPDHWYVYDMWEDSIFDDEPLYIGTTDNVHRRLTQHRRNKHWWPEVAVITVTTFATPTLARIAESERIYRSVPKYNVSGVRL